MIVEVQIRTHEMDLIAESGIAAHWMYKSDKDQDGIPAAPASTRKWLNEIMEIQQSAGNSLEFLESVKVDLFPEEIYVFTPAGDIIVLPRGSSGVDLAYAVHSDLGNTCVAVKVDRRTSPLSTRLENGQTVEVISTPSARPRPSWLSFVATTKASERLFEKALSRYNKTPAEIDRNDFTRLLASVKLDSMPMLYAEIGLGERVAELMIENLLGIENPKPRRSRKSARKKSAGQDPLAIRGTEGVVVNFGKCCNPIPGDQIIGIMTAGKGLVIHRSRCRNIDRKNAFKDKWVSVSWAHEQAQDFIADIRVETINQRGVLAKLASKIAAAGSNIDDIVFADKDDKSTSITFSVGVRDRKHLAGIIRTLRANTHVLKASRMRG